MAQQLQKDGTESKAEPSTESKQESHSLPGWGSCWAEAALDRTALVKTSLGGLWQCWIRSKPFNQETMFRSLCHGHAASPRPWALFMLR